MVKFCFIFVFTLFALRITRIKFTFLASFVVGIAEILFGNVPVWSKEKQKLDGLKTSEILSAIPEIETRWVLSRFRADTSGTSAEPNSYPSVFRLVPHSPRNWEYNTCM